VEGVHERVLRACTRGYSSTMTSVEPQSWHHGLVARWWSLFRTSGPEIEYFRRFV
jgi:hypothetical protein